MTVERKEAKEDRHCLRDRDGVSVFGKPAQECVRSRAFSCPRVRSVLPRAVGN